LKFNIVIFNTVDMFFVKQLLYHNITIVDSDYEVLVLLRRVNIDIVISKNDKLKSITPFILISEKETYVENAQDVLSKSTFSVQRVEFACYRARAIQKYYRDKENAITYFEFIKTLSMVQNKIFNKKLEDSVLHDILFSFFLLFNLHVIRLDLLDDYNYTCKIIFNKKIEDTAIEGIIPLFWKDVVNTTILENPSNVDKMFFGDFSVISSKIHNYIFSIYYYKIDESIVYMYNIIKNLLSWVIKEIEDNKKITVLANSLDASIKEITYHSELIGKIT
jgi:hypothetical protein